MATQYFQSPRNPSAIAARAEALLHRYPNVSETELAELINLMPKVPVLEIGLMTADDELSTRLDSFHRDHGDKLRPAAATVAAMLMVPFALLAAIAWWAVS